MPDLPDVIPMPEHNDNCIVVDKATGNRAWRHGYLGFFILIALRVLKHEAQANP